jgi:hypothetical protein
MTGAVAATELWNADRLDALRSPDLDFQNTIAELNAVAAIGDVSTPNNAIAVNALLYDAAQSFSFTTVPGEPILSLTPPSAAVTMT